MPDARLTRTRATLPTGYQFGDMQTECWHCGWALWLGGEHPVCVDPGCLLRLLAPVEPRGARILGA